MRIATWVATLAVVAAGPVCAAHAQAVQTSSIVRIEGDDVFIDAGADRVSTGDELDVRRSIEIRHPVSRRVLRDRFVVGRLRIGTVGERLSIGQVIGTPWRPMSVGDTVELPTPAALPEAPAETGSTTEAPAEPGVATATAERPARSRSRPSSAQLRALLEVFHSTLGRPPEERIRAFTAYLSLHLDSPFRDWVAQEILSLQGWLRTVAPTLEQPRDGTVHWQPIRRARRGAPLSIALLARPEAGLRALVLHARGIRALHADAAFRTVHMSLDRVGHARARLPSDLVDGDAFEYFVEGVARDGRVVAVVASAASPLVVELELRPGARAREIGRSRVRVSAEMVDFDFFSGRDWYFLAEADFLYRLRFGFLYGIRVGYGAYRGEGGTVEQLDTLDEPPRPAGYTYGYTELELRPFAGFGLIFRATAGLGRPDDSGADQREGLRPGFQIRGRIGRERGTHLLFGAETLPELGERALVGLAFEVIRDVPMAGEVQVTDQPVAGDLAVRLIYEIGYRVSDAVSLSTRLSYQGRTIDHTGLGGGVAATFDW